MFLALVAAIAFQQNPDRVTFGFTEIRAALEKQKLESWAPRIHVTQDPSLGKEGYVLWSEGNQIEVKGGDKNGLMYGELELAERILNDGTKAFAKGKIYGKPYLEDRGWNMFIPLPWDYEKNFVDNDPAALIDPNRWFFQNEDYWNTLLKILAKSRFNWLDIHGPYDLDTTRFPNLYAYFIQSDRFPNVGVAPEIKAKNLDRLRWVIRLAHEYGIKVSLMSYEARFDTPHNPNPGYKGTEEEVYDYTKEVVEKMIRQVPELDKIGFRIGESGRGPEFFKCYQDAVKASGRNIPLYTRSWVTRKARVVPLARQSDDFTVEIKYNGEQWGSPYIMAGGRTANWYSYWYEDYLSDSGSEKAAKMWPGVEVGSEQLAFGGSDWPKPEFYFGGQKVKTKVELRSGPTEIKPKSAKSSGPPTANHQPPTSSERWPSEPYKIVWQVRANGTHRIFPFYQPEWTRRSILSMKMGTASGYTVESMCSYFPQEPRYYRGSNYTGYKWLPQRDEMYITCWGRLGYEPTVKQSVFDHIAKRKLGDGTTDQFLYQWKNASKAVPVSFMAYGLGPDHRSHAPELEWGGDIEQFLIGEPFDSHVFMSAKEELALRATGGRDGRVDRTDLQKLDFSSDYMAGSIEGEESDLKDSPIGLEIANGIAMMDSWLGYWTAKIQAARELGLSEAEPDSYEHMRYIGRWLDIARTNWATLSGDGGTFMRLFTGRMYHPFSDRLRMHVHDFHWEKQRPAVVAESQKYKDMVDRGAFDKSKRFMDVPALGLKVGVRLTNGAAHITLPSSDLRGAWLLEKPLPSSTFFHKSPMRRSRGSFVADFKREPWGHAVAVEVQLRSGKYRRLPWWEREQPYIVVPSQQKSTPPIYCTEEALSYLKPEILNPSKYGWLVVATRGRDFFAGFPKPMQRKLLPALEKGMNLLVMQQDLTSGRYPMDWLPVKPNVANLPIATFDPGGALGLEKVETNEIIWQPFEPSPGWQVYGNGGVASFKYGKGTIWMVQARLIQRMHIPAAARNLKSLLELTAPPEAGGPRRKPAIIVDPGTEGDLSTSVIPDFMNAHDIPFFTLGEVVAKEQGMDSLTVIPGPVMDDDVLGGKGKEMANKWLREQVVKASKLAAPSSLELFEKERKRRKAELLKSLGLDPMPPKSPLNARITGTIQRSGYKIEKLVYESRPNFFVTCHVYVPDPKPLGKLPVVVHVNGHWAHKKDEDRIQLRAAFCATQGYLAIAIDSPGHSFEGNSLIERRPEGDHNDWFLVQGGSNATGYYVWDVVRGLDYLETRGDCDMSKIGLTGASGGGLATLYAFAAEDRFAAAVPVVYMSSMELAPDNGCLCNHVPATCQVGDRSDVIAIQAPKPVYIFGAQNDPEFPPDAMRLTGKKMIETWSLFGKGDDAKTRIYEGQHDYNQLMREAMIGFFNKYLKGEGDGSPVPQPPLEAINPEDHQLLALDPPAPNERTMRDLSLEYLANAPKEVSLDQVFAINGGKPTIAPTNLKMNGTQPKFTATFEAEPGLTTPAIFLMGADLTKPVTIVVSDDGKAGQIAKDGKGSDSRLYLDILGTGELGGIELRYPIYLGKSPAFIGGIQISGAAKLLRQNGHGGQIHIEAHGPLSSLAALYAGLLDSSFSKITASGSLRSWEDVFKPGITPYAVQPRAHLLGTLENLRKMVKNATWGFRSD